MTRRPAVPRSPVVLATCVVAVCALAACGPLGGEGDDGNGVGRIAYVGENVVAVRAADGSGTATALIPATTEILVGPRFAPAGDRVLYFSTGPMGGALYEVAADGTGTPRQVTAFETYALGGGWSADGKKIVFYAQPGGGGNDRTLRELFVVNADGTGETRLTNDALEDAEPCFLPDGRIVWAKQPPGQSVGYREIYVADADGSNARALTAGGAAKYNPAVSPDGTRIVFDTNDVFVMNADGTGQTKIGQGHFASFSPDGTKIVFNDANSGGIATMAPDGTGLAQLFAGSQPSWGK